MTFPGAEAPRLLWPQTPEENSSLDPATYADLVAMGRDAEAAPETDDPVVLVLEVPEGTTHLLNGEEVDADQAMTWAGAAIVDALRIIARRPSSWRQSGQ